MTCMPVTFMLRLLHSVVVRSPNLASHKRRENVSVVPPDDDSYSTANVFFTSSRPFPTPRDSLCQRAFYNHPYT
eukprot:COSAG02_NODE_6681_length_3421_cov_52.109573_3_plen_74_part_00